MQQTLHKLSSDSDRVLITVLCCRNGLYIDFNVLIGSNVTHQIVNRQDTNILALSKYPTSVHHIGVKRLKYYSTNIESVTQ